MRLDSSGKKNKGGFLYTRCLKRYFHKFMLDNRVEGWRNIRTIIIVGVGMLLMLLTFSAFNIPMIRNIFAQRISNISSTNYPFRWGFMDGALSCEVLGYPNILKDINNFAKTPSCGEVRIVMQYPKSTNLLFYRQMEIANALLCNLAQCSVEEIHLLQEDDDTKSFMDFFRSQTEKLLQHGSHHVNNFVRQVMASFLETKVIVRRIGHRMQPNDATQYINKHPEWEGKPIVMTNADISISKGFENSQLLKRLLRDNSVSIIKRHEPENCHMLGDYFKKKSVSCSCADRKNCSDSYLLTYPVPEELLKATESESSFSSSLLKERGSRLWSPCLSLHLKHHMCTPHDSSIEEQPFKLGDVECSAGVSLQLMTLQDFVTSTREAEGL
mmetsp:Transcript_7949/g.11998  ORF Transcript_7949/g.11998 Transcript_7949/m.11998 type:complete len:384 (+) Transcript_7949:48-1199(+)